MDLELILDSDTISKTFSDLGKMKEFLSTLEYIDQPINTTLSSLLQVCCQYAKDDTVVKYLLKNGANPNYLDINGKDARFYIDHNKNKIAGVLCLNELSGYMDLFPKEDPEERKQIGFDLIRNEIAKYREEVQKKNEAIEELKYLCQEWEATDGK